MHMARKLLLSTVWLVLAPQASGFHGSNRSWTRRRTIGSAAGSVRAEQDDMIHPATQALYAYWNEVRGDRLAPRRLEIQPARIAEHLLDTFILERSGRSAFRFRLAGTRVA